MGFLLCIKIIKKRDNTCESRIYNVEKLCSDLDYYKKKYFESALT